MIVIPETPSELARVIRRNHRRAPKHLHEDIRQACWQAWLEAKNVGGDATKCIGAAEAAAVAVRQPRGSRLGKAHGRGAVAAIARPSGRDACRDESNRERGAPAGDAGESAIDVLDAPRCDPGPPSSSPVEDLAAPERGWLEPLLASMTPLIREFVEGKFIRNESYEVVAKAWNMSISEARSCTALAKECVRKRMRELDRRGELTRSFGLQEWRRRVLAWAESTEPDAVELPPGWDIRQVRGEFVPRRCTEPSPMKRYAISITSGEMKEGGWAGLFPGVDLSDDDVLHVFTLDLGVPTNRDVE